MKSIRWAVPYATGRHANSRSRDSSPIGNNPAAGAATYSASPPCSVSPSIPRSEFGLTTTAVPGSMPLTPGPSASTHPAMSPPLIWGNVTGSPGMPRRTKMSR